MADITTRPFRANDFDAFFELASRWDVVRQLGGYPWPANPDMIRARCKPFEGNGFVHAICDDDQLIGTIGVVNADLGYMLHPAYHRQGIIFRVARMALNDAFANSANSVITAATWHDNPASHALLLRLGFAHYNTRYAHALARRTPTLLRTYRLTRVRWDSLSSRAQ